MSRYLLYEWVAATADVSFKVLRFKVKLGLISLPDKVILLLCPIVQVTVLSALVPDEVEHVPKIFNNSLDPPLRSSSRSVLNSPC